jgi:hypothetical protein
LSHAAYQPEESYGWGWQSRGYVQEEVPWRRSLMEDVEVQGYESEEREDRNDNDGEDYHVSRVCLSLRSQKPSDY